MTDQKTAGAETFFKLTRTYSRLVNQGHDPVAVVMTQRAYANVRALTDDADAFATAQQVMLAAASREGWTLRTSEHLPLRLSKTDADRSAAFFVTDDGTRFDVE